MSCAIKGDPHMTKAKGVIAALMAKCFINLIKTPLFKKFTVH
jgi:hypothetical protein